MPSAYVCRHGFRALGEVFQKGDIVEAEKLENLRFGLLRVKQGDIWELRSEDDEQKLAEKIAVLAARSGRDEEELSAAVRAILFPAAAIITPPKPPASPAPIPPTPPIPPIPPQPPKLS